MGRNLAIFDNDHNTTEEGRSWIALGSYSQAYGFASITMYSWWQSGEIGCAYRICNSLRGGGEAGRAHHCTYLFRQPDQWSDILMWEALIWKRVAVRRTALERNFSFLFRTGGNVIYKHVAHTSM